jgi:geranylgeranyl diphosphate synthase type I
MTQVGFAQMQDVAGIHYGSKKMEDILQLYRYKTGRYTFSLPLKLGAVLGGVDRALIEKLEYFGQELGTAFQIHDDYLGIFGNEKKLGKNISSDIRERKMTLLLFLLMKAIKDPKEKKVLHEYIATETVSAEMITQIKELMKQHKVDILTLKQVKAFTSSAEHILEDLALDRDHKQTLRDLIEQLLSRQS